MIVVFSNHGFGAPIVDSVLDVARQRGEPITIVRSSKGRTWKGHFRHGVPERLAATLRRLASGGRVRTRVTADINDSEFIQSIPLGTHGLVAGFNQIFRQETIDRFASLVNLHPSVLPLYRGPTPSHWCIENHEQSSGYTLHGITARIDDGPIYYQETVCIDDLRSPAEVDRRIAKAAAPCVQAWLTATLDATPWTPRRVDAAGVYRTAVGYRGFPSKG